MSAGSKLDLSGFHINFDDSFNTMSVGGAQATAGSVNWFAPVHTPFGAAVFQAPTAAVNPFSVSDGALTIEMANVSGQWQSGLMQTVNASGQGFQQQYGYFEMSAKFPAGAGSWPAFWLLSSDSTKPRIEVDVVEAYGGDVDGLHSAIHVSPVGGSGGVKVDNSEYTSVTGSMFDGQFHTYGAMVTPDWVIIYFDRTEVTRFPASDYFKTPLYMVVDLGLDPTDAAKASGTYDMVIDYVRAYADPTLTALVETGGAGADSLTGTTFNDTFDGAAGADTMAGGAGDDTYYVDNAGDRVIEAANSGTDKVYASTSFSLGGQYIEDLTLTGAAAINATGNSLANHLNGNAASNVLDGREGADTMAGGGGDDTYYVDNAGDQVIEAAGGGVDTVYSSVTFSLGGQYVEDLTLTGSQAINATGNSLANHLNGNAANNVLDGREGADTMAGGAGDDTYYIDNGGDQVVEAAGAGTDTVISSLAFNLANTPYVENLTLAGSANVAASGNALDNRLVGNSGANALFGNQGADTLAGGAGADTLNGGAGADIFVFNTTLNTATNVDIIADFNMIEDRIQLDDAVFAALKPGVLTNTGFQVGTQALTADTHVIYNKATGDIYYDPDGAGGADQIKFVHIAANLNVTAANFVVV